jgi:outer membrane protein TolC
MKYYNLFLALAILSIQTLAQADITLTSASALEMFKTKSLKPQEIQNTLNQSEALFEVLDAKYKLTTTLDLSKQNDKTDSLSTSLQQSNDLDKYTWLLSKRFLTGTTLGFEATHLQNQYQLTAAETNQNYLSLNIDQPLFPNFFGSQERSIYNSASNDFKIKQIQTDIDQLSAQKDMLQLYWKAKSLSTSVEENKKMIAEYDKLIKKIEQKKQFQFAAAGELEQALSEYETKKQNFKSDQAAYLDAVNNLKIALNLKQESTITFSTDKEQQSLPVFTKHTSENLKRFQLQKLKLKSASEQSSSVQNTNLPQLSLYGKYTQSGYDPSNSAAWTEAQDSNYRKYLIGLKLDYTFDNSKSDLDQKIKKLSYDIEKNRSERTDTDLSEQIEITQTQLKNSFENMNSNQIILEYRKKAVADISRNYFQGRSDISLLVDAYNKRILAEVNLINSQGDFELKKIDYASLVLE